MTNSIDPTTGLPELPAGYFWRVALNDLGRYGFDPLELQIRQRLLHFFSEKMDYEYTTEERLPRTADYMAETFHTKRARRAYQSELIGDYPPKKLVIK